MNPTEDDDQTQEWTCETTGTRFDLYLTEMIDGLSRAQAHRIIEEGAATVNGKTVKPSHKLKAGERITFTIPEIKPSEVLAQNIPLEILYEDSDLLVVNKPKGLVVHPAPGSRDGTLVNALLYHCKGSLSGIGGVERPGIVHRLDKDTSGLLVVAKNDTAHRELQAQIQSREAKRTYLAVVLGNPSFEQAVVDAPIMRHPSDRLKMAVSAPGEGREAITNITVLERFGVAALLECRLDTGRTHQIRVHCQFSGLPVVGDPLYGGLRRTGEERLDILIQRLHGQALHACALAFRHPTTNVPLAFTSPPPREIVQLLKQLRSE